MSLSSKGGDEKPPFHERWISRRREEGSRSLSPTAPGSARASSSTHSGHSSHSSSAEENPSFNLIDFTPTATQHQPRPHTIHGGRPSVFRPDTLLPIIESSPSSENPTLPSTPRSMSASLKLNDGHSPTGGNGGKKLPLTPPEVLAAAQAAQAEVMSAPATAAHTRQSSVHSTAGEDKANGTNGAGEPGPTVRVSSPSRRPHSSWHPPAPSYTLSNYTPADTPTLRESASQVTLISEPREAETARLKEEVRRLADAMNAMDCGGHAGHGERPGHVHSHSLPNNQLQSQLPSQHQPHQNDQLQPQSQGQMQHNSQLQRSVPPPHVVPGFHPMQAGFMPFMAFWPPPQPQYIPCNCAGQVQQLKEQLADLAEALERLDFRPATPPHSPPKYRVRRPLPPRPVSSPPPATTGSASGGSSTEGKSGTESKSEEGTVVSSAASESSAGK